jgi:hypothetical protein
MAVVRAVIRTGTLIVFVCTLLVKIDRTVEVGANLVGCAAAQHKKDQDREHALKEISILHCVTPA